MRHMPSDSDQAVGKPGREDQRGVAPAVDCASATVHQLTLGVSCTQCCPGSARVCQAASADVQTVEQARRQRLAERR